MKKIQIGFLGYGTRALDELMEHPDFEVRYFIVPRKSLCGEVYEAMETYKHLLKIILVSDNKELAKILSDIHDVNCFLMNACPLILNEQVLSCMEIYNIHPGDLNYNRGHHPHLWTVLLEERKSKITLHKVDTGIDEGLVIKSVPVLIGGQDNAGEVLRKLEDQIPLLLDALYGYRMKGVPPEGVITGGGYRRKMEHSDYEIDLEQDNEQDIRRKIRTRSMHHGAFIKSGGKRYYVDGIKNYYYQPNWNLHNENIIFEADEDNGTFFVAAGNQIIFFHLNKIEEGKL